MRRPFVIVHPCDVARGRQVARLLNASLLTIENWPAELVGFDGIRNGPYTAHLVREYMPGWRPRFLAPRPKTEA